MSSRSTPETLLISAMLKEQDPFLAKEFGIIPEHFRGYREEYEWVLTFYSQYGETPTPTQFRTKFPHAPIQEDCGEPRWAAQEVKRSWASRDLLARCNRATELLGTGNVEDAYEAVKGAQLELVAPRPDNALVDPHFLDDYDAEQADRVAVPWKTLQKLTNGVGEGELWYLAARQGNGKTSFLVDMAVEAAFNGHRVCLYSMEMTKRQIQVRAHAAMAHRLGIKVDEHAMLHHNFDQEEYKEVLRQIKDRLEESGGELATHTPDMGKVSPGVIAGMAEDYDMHVIDYIGLMYTDDGRPVVSDWRDIAQVSGQLKEIALAKKTRILSASQVNREGAGPSPRPPALRHLAQSDFLGNDGDVVLTMKRYGTGASVFSVEKNRHGPSLNLFYTMYDPNRGDFTEITSDRANDIKDQTDD